MRILHDLFPARVRVISSEEARRAREAAELTTYTQEFGRAVDRVRVVLTDALLLVAADSDSGPVLIFRDAYVPEELEWPKDRREKKLVTTRTEKLVVIEYDSNCGCGSRLRSWNPYNIVGSSRDPGPDDDNEDKDEDEDSR